MLKRQILAPEKRQILAPGKADDLGWIPLHYAAHLGKTELVELFLTEYDESLAYARNKEGMSALHISAKKGHVEVIRKLIERCPEICELLDDKNQTALHVAVESGVKSVVKVLLESLAFQDLVNEKDNEGNTALHLASTQRHFDILAMLANDSKTDKGATNKDGMTFIDIILSNKELKNIDLWEIVLKFQKEIIGIPSLEQKSIRKSKEAESCEKLTHNDGRLQNLEEKEEKLTHNYGRPQKLKEKEEKQHEVSEEITKDVDSFTTLVATLIATVTFTAALPIPGGYNDKGLAVSLQRRQPFNLFLFFDVAAFFSSFAIMLIRFSSPLSRKLVSFFHMIKWVLILADISLFSMFIAFVCGIGLVVPEKSNIADVVCLCAASFVGFISFFYLSPILTIVSLNKKDVRHGFGF
nr:ankyrin repeat-containing protein At5g02620-like [Ziziphus jujuba var. spinosa]